MAEWERITHVVLEYCLVTPHDQDQGKRILQLVLALSMGYSPEDLREVASSLPDKDALDKLTKLFFYQYPHWELTEDEYRIDQGRVVDPATDKKGLLDTESVGNDVPNELVDLLLREESKPARAKKISAKETRRKGSRSKR